MALLNQRYPIGIIRAGVQASMACYAGAEDPQECVLQKEDYIECLHRTKEIARAKEIKSHFLQQQAHELGDARKAADVAAKGVIVSLGLVKPIDDSGSESEK
ncbi:hypothetical protein QFC20_001509 [Naganishia adeliensis]|uniref:Uncharacterized protein n=1 Tax=Naganishia adeliensis TaxID=92952 RepID=A0ACC2WSG9_9TREE|nr:hypothetical protein QFC20_001509 [Naganishia adeliensis]